MHDATTRSDPSPAGVAPAATAAAPILVAPAPSEAPPFAAPPAAGAPMCAREHVVARRRWRIPTDPPPV